LAALRRDISAYVDAHVDGYAHVAAEYSKIRHVASTSAALS